MKELNRGRLDLSRLFNLAFAAVVLSVSKVDGMVWGLLQSVIIHSKLLIYYSDVCLV